MLKYLSFDIFQTGGVAMYEYSDKERKEIRERIEDVRYKNKPVDQALFYELYDLVRITLEGVAEISERLDAIEKKLS